MNITDLTPAHQAVITELADAAYTAIRTTPPWSGEAIFELVEQLAIGAFLAGSLAQQAFDTQRRSSGANNAGSHPRDQTSSLAGHRARKYAAGDGTND